MAGPSPATPTPSLRLLLGLAQMFGALLGLVMLATSGVTPRLLGVVAGTTLLTILSRNLHRRQRPR